MGKDENITTKQNSYSVHELYDKYSGMLFGYIYEIVKDTELAEQQLISFYSTIKEQLSEINVESINTWCQLQRLIKKHLSANFSHSIPVETDLTVSHTSNKFLSKMTSEQQYVFCNVYYNGKTVTDLAYLLNKPEELVRRDLKGAFVVLKQQT